LHYGKDRKQFRIHGFYDDKGYFNILRLDLNHKYHK
ncbi:MAG6450 family protein, partial [Staphylococcus gallinarum]